MSQFSLDNFRAQVLQNGLAKAHRFEVMILSPASQSAEGARLASMFAEGTQLPQTRINTTQMRMWGSPRIMPLWAEYGGDNISINFFLDRQMEVKKYFDAWIDRVVSRQDSTVSYYDDIIANIEIHQLDEQDRSSYGVVLKEAYPISVNPVQLDMGNSGVSRLSVTFAYKKWFQIGVPVQENPKPPIDPRKDNRIDKRKVDYLGQSSPLGGNMEDPMSFDTNSFFGA